jgi:hypothetical protein
VLLALVLAEVLALVWQQIGLARVDWSGHPTAETVLADWLQGQTLECSGIACLLAETLSACSPSRLVDLESKCLGKSCRCTKVLEVFRYPVRQLESADSVPLPLLAKRLALEVQADPPLHPVAQPASALVGYPL